MPATGALLSLLALKLLDKERKVPGRYGTEKFPESFLIDKDGKVRFYVISDRDWAAPPLVPS